MRVIIDTSNFSTCLRFSDKIIGSSEYSLGNVYFLYNNGLVLRATDGCLSSWMRVGSCEPFEGEIAVPLRLLKGFLTGDVGENLNLTLSGDQLVVSYGNETLKMKLFGGREKQFPVEHELVARSNSMSFVKALDFATSPLEEGDFTSFGSFEDRLFIFAPTHSIVCLSCVSGELVKPFVFSFPYTSARHIVKAFEVYKKKVPLNFGLDEALIIESVDFIMQLCGEKGSVDPRIGRFLGQQRESFPLPNGFRKFISKAAWFIPRESTIKIECTKGSLRFFGTYGTVTYRAMLPFEFPLSFGVEFSPHKMRSALSRMSTKLLLSVGDDFVKIEDGNGKIVVVKRI
ncbi:hypothetical protein [Pseudothermotoga sp.]|nr:hypothetical protein [Pseudothermotoga sp.]MDW8139317.1 hypothetical protein [Pseudothermotoga sp.]